MRELKATIAQLRGTRAPEAGGAVWRDNAPIVAAFLAVDTQWRTATVGGGMEPSFVHFIGLDYAAVKIGLDAAGIAVTPDKWRGIRVMEDAARAALNGSR